MTGSAVAAPKVFISYSHDSPEHQDRVLALSDRLRTDGIDAVIDQYEPAPREGWPRWTERQIEDADFVLLICTETYLRRVQNRETSGAGRGVVWEANLIYNHIYAASSIAGKFAAVLLDVDRESLVPTPLRGATYYTVADESGYEALYRHLTNQPAAVRTALGSIHSLPGRRPRSYPASYHESRTQHAADVDDRNRHTMLARVYHDWIQGVLDRSLYKVARLDFVVSSAPDAVENRFPICLEPRVSTAARLTRASTIGEVFDEHVGALLILGAPGAGKTTLLLELASTLHGRAEVDRNLPVPVIFNLSSWSVRRPALAAWLVDELNERYDMPRVMAQNWVDHGEVLPLLDGLDEVADADREACVAAINDFRRENGLLPIAVCGRATEYESLSTRLRLSAAVVIQPLTKPQVIEYLEREDTALSAVRDAASRDPSIIELLDTPLALDIVRRAFQSGGDNAFLADERIHLRREQLVECYVEAVFRRRTTRSPYDKNKSREWLGRLARMMTQHNQSTFHLESLRPDWLPSQRQCGLASAGMWVAVAVLAAAFFLITDAAYLAVFGAPDLVLLSDRAPEHAAALRTMYNPFNPIVQVLFAVSLACVAALTTGRIMSTSLSLDGLGQTALRGFAWGGIVGARVGGALGAVAGFVLGLVNPGDDSHTMRFAAPLFLAAVLGTLLAIMIAILGSLAGLFAGTAVAISIGPRVDALITRPSWTRGAVWRTTRRGFRLGLLIGGAASVSAVVLVAFVDPAALRGENVTNTTGLVITTILFSIVAGIGGSLVGAFLGPLAGSIIGLVFAAPVLPSLRPLLSSLVTMARGRPEIRPVDRVRWSWRHPRNGFDGAIQFSVLGGILGAVLLGPLGALGGVLEPFLASELASPFGPVSIQTAGRAERAAFAVEPMLVGGLFGAMAGAMLMALSLAPLGFIEGMLVRTDLGTRSAPNEGSARSARAAAVTSLCVGLALAVTQVPLALMGAAVLHGIRSPMSIGVLQMALMSVVSGAQIGMVCAAIRNGGLFVLQHFVVRIVLWWTGSAPLLYARFLDHAAGQLTLLRKVGGGYIFTHRFVMEYFASLTSTGQGESRL